MPDDSARPSDADVVRQYLDAIGQRDPDRIVSFVTDDYTSVHIAAIAPRSWVVLVIRVPSLASCRVARRGRFGGSR